MGRKVHPIGFRLNINQPWSGRWFAEGKEYVEQLHQDFAVRKMIHDVAGKAGVSNVEVCLLYTSPSPRDLSTSRMPSSA